MKGPTRFEWFEQGHALEAVGLGIIDPSVFQKFIRYKVYLDFRSQGKNHVESMYLTSDQNRCSYSTVWRDIKWFS